MGAGTSFFEKVQAEVEAGIFQTWFWQTRLEVDAEGRPILTVPHDFTKDWIHRTWGKRLNEIAREIWDRDLQIDVGEAIAGAGERPAVVPAPPAAKAPPAPPKVAAAEQDFEAFIHGEENLLPWAAARTIAPGRTDGNPFVIVGGPGMGKSLLAKAVSGRWEEAQRTCLGAEEFAVAYVQAMQENRLPAFQAMLRSKRLLVVEDLHYFLEGNKKKTVEELLHTLRAMRKAGRQLVLTTSRPVADFEAASPALRDFLLSGLKVTLAPPAADSRKKLLRRMCAEAKVVLAPSVLEFLDAVPFRSPGDLAGAMRQLLAYCALDKGRMPLASVKEILADHLRQASAAQAQGGGADLFALARTVAKRYGLTFQRLVSHSRERHVSLARHMAMALAHDDLRIPLREIGGFFGGRSHQTVLFGVTRVRQARAQDPEMARVYEGLKAELLAAAATAAG